MIGAIINSVLGIGKSITDGNVSKYAANTDRLQSNVDYERYKESAYYDTYKKQALTILLIISIGCALVAGIYYLNKKNG